LAVGSQSVETFFGFLLGYLHFDAILELSSINLNFPANLRLWVHVILTAEGHEFVVGVR
jgi:hypothetical protein|tara:strand:- start:207 stop:383 length:177 start_codon:yes stop_codon:yes gene_type:complete